MSEGTSKSVPAKRTREEETQSGHSQDNEDLVSSIADALDESAYLDEVTKAALKAFTRNTYLNEHESVDPRLSVRPKVSFKMADRTNDSGEREVVLFQVYTNGSGSSLRLKVLPVSQVDDSHLTSLHQITDQDRFGIPLAQAAFDPVARILNDAGKRSQGSELLLSKEDVAAILDAGLPRVPITHSSIDDDEHADSSELRNRLAAYKDANFWLTRELEHWRSNTEEPNANQVITALQNDKLAEKRKADAFQSQRDSLSRRVKTLEAQIESIKHFETDFVHAEQAWVIARDEAQAFKDENARLERALEAHKVQNSARVHELESELASKSQLAEKVTPLETELADVQEKLSALQSETADLSDKFNASQGEIASLTEKLTESQNESADLKKKLNASRKSKKHLEETTNYLQSQYKAASDAAKLRADEAHSAEEQVTYLKTALHEGLQIRRQFEEDQLVQSRHKVAELTEALTLEREFIRRSEIVKTHHVATAMGRGLVNQGFADPSDSDDDVEHSAAESPAVASAHGN